MSNDNSHKVEAKRQKTWELLKELYPERESVVQEGTMGIVLNWEKLDVLFDYITNKVNEEVIKELEELVIAQGTYDEDRAYGHGKFHHVPAAEVQARISELKAVKGNT